MLDFLGYKKGGKAKNKVELVSVHVPKSAGTSFRNMLKAIYGEEQVARLDIHLIDKHVKLETKLFNKRRLPSNIKVLHGHFSPELLLENFEIAADVPFITWLRDPVDRVISNHYYLAKRLKEEMPDTPNSASILRVMQRSLIEYAKAEINRNRIHKFLAGKPISAFAFVGIQEHFAEDVAVLAQQMGWDTPPLLHQNKTGNSHEVSTEDRAIIEQFNQQDMALYRSALDLRAKRLN